MWEKLDKALRGKLLLILVGVLGVGLILFGSCEKETQEEALPTEFEACELYRLTLQKEAEELCRQVKGVGDVAVYITLEKGEVTTYSGSKVTSVTPPVVAGVAVVCEGGDSDRVKKEVSGLLSAMLDIGVNRIYISSMK